MFRYLGATIRYAAPLCVLAWLAAFFALYWTAPPWGQVVQDREFGFLPADAPSRQGDALFKKAFPDDKQNSNIVIVLSRAHAELKDADRTFIRDTVTPALLRLAKEEGGLADQLPANARKPLPIIAAIRTPDNRGSGALLLSDDGQAALVVIELTTELLETRNWPLVAKVERLIADWRSHDQRPKGLHVDLIGSATVGRDMTVGQVQSAKATEFWTVIIVIAILVLVYRAPFLALIPLISVFMATQFARQLLAHLAAAGWVTVFVGIEIYITVILYGTGVDYCLFLISRYEEERARLDDCGEAMAETVRHAGPALVASAATVIFGIGMMIFAKFGKFHHAGIAIAIGLVISLCVVLTFTTSLLRLVGRLAFWPRKLKPYAPESHPDWLARWLSWEVLARALLAHPALIWLGAVLVLSPLVAIGFVEGDNVDYNFVARLPPNAPSVAGTKALHAHFPAGIGGIITLLIYQPHLDFLETDGIGQIELSALTDRLRQRQTRLGLANLRSWSRPLGTGWAAAEATGAPLAELDRGLKDARHYYISTTGPLKGKVTRIELVMYDDPLSRQGIAWLDDIEAAIRSELYGELRSAQLYFIGTTADMRDLRNITQRDQLHIQVLVTVCVLTILMILLRRPGVSLYLIATVLFSYFATLGAAVLFFWWLAPNDFVGLDWKVPIFLFTILVATGEDYNIFLMTRVAEEQAAHGPLEGIRVALVRTGRIITTCGLIMAGTFASLMAGSMQDLQHLGFALAFGVLLDTFVVRPILVPAVLILVERGRAFWTKLSETVEKGQREDDPSREIPS